MYIFSIESIQRDFFRIGQHTDVLCPLHLHGCTEIVCVTSGILTMTVSDESRIIHEGEATIIMPFERHSFATEHHSECFVIEFGPEITEDFSTLTKGQIPSVKVCKIEGCILDMCDKMLPKGKTPNSIELKSILYPLLSEIYSKCNFVKGSKTYEKAFIEAIRYAGENYKTGITLKSTAKALGVHYVYLSRIFKNTCGMSYTKYLNSLRCSNAARQLDFTSQNVSEIAFESGFGSIRSFNREFISMFGMTPVEYREKVSDITKAVRK